jgi:hypothetical protein
MLLNEVVDRRVEIEERELLRAGEALLSQGSAEFAEALAGLGEHVAGVAVVEDFGAQLVEQPLVDGGEQFQVSLLAGEREVKQGKQALLLLLVVEQGLGIGPGIARRKVVF